MNKCTVIFSDGIFERDTVEELVASNHDVCLTFVPQKHFSASPEVIIVVFEFMKNLAFSATYDMMKYTLLSLIDKIKQKVKNLQSSTNETIITVIKDDKKKQMIFSCELTENQWDKIVEATIQEFLK